MRYTLRDLLRAINVLDEDIDVSVDGHDTIAVVAPIELTAAAEVHFYKALKLPIRDRSVYTDTDGNEGDKELDLAWELLSSLAGNCSESDFAKWFKGTIRQKAFKI